MRLVQILDQFVQREPWLELGKAMIPATGASTGAEANPLNEGLGAARSTRCGPGLASFAKFSFESDYNQELDA